MGYLICYTSGGTFAKARRWIMRISARNQFKGTVTKVTKGATTSHVVVDIGNGKTVTSSITNESVDELGIKDGGKVLLSLNRPT
jgi:molybdopterin-binding protein